MKTQDTSAVLRGSPDLVLPSRPTTFLRLALLTTVFAYLQISLGAVVRVSGSGLGCGNQWPLCRGHIYPPANLEAIVEYTHRTVGSLTGLLLIATVVVGWLTFRKRRPLITWLVTAAAATIVVEGLLGALVVFRDLAGVLVLAHLAVALALLGLLVAAAVLALPSHGPALDHSSRRLLLLAVAVTYVLLLTGAGVVASHADDLCKSWPLCGSGWTLDFGGVNAYTMLHRLFAAVAGLFLIYTLGAAARRWPAVPYLRLAAALTLLVLLVQVGIGYPAAVTHDSPLVNGLHVAVAAAVWVGVVVTTALAHRSSASPT